MKFVFCIVVLPITFSSCRAQNNEKAEVVKTYHNNGKVFTESTMKNGKKNGEERIFHDNGNIMYKQYFKDDMLVDSFYQYSKEEAGKLEIIGYSIPISRFIALDYPSMRTIGISDYKAKQIGEGIVKTFHENGNIMGITEYQNNQEEGIRILYYQNGNIKSIKHKKGGAVVPPIIEFDSTGNLIQYVPKSK